MVVKVTSALTTSKACSTAFCVVHHYIYLYSFIVAEILDQTFDDMVFLVTDLRNLLSTEHHDNQNKTYKLHEYMNTICNLCFV